MCKKINLILILCIIATSAFSQNNFEYSLQKVEAVMIENNIVYGVINNRIVSQINSLQITNYMYATSNSYSIDRSNSRIIITTNSNGRLYYGGGSPIIISYDNLFSFGVYNGVLIIGNDQNDVSYATQGRSKLFKFFM